MTGMQSAISCIAVHPTKSILAIAGSEGFILLWDYNKRGDPINNNYELYKKEEGPVSTDNSVFTAMEFVQDGNGGYEILVATNFGEIIIMSETGLWKEVPPLKTTDRTDRKGFPVTQLIVTPDGNYFACSDKNKAISLFKKDHPHGDTKKPLEWMFSGKIISHEIEVSSIAFGVMPDENDNPVYRLFSIGKDRRMFEYDVYNSHQNDPLIVLNYFTIEQEATPSACLWYPKKDSKEGLLLTANNEYKMKVWNPSA